MFIKFSAINLFFVFLLFWTSTIVCLAYGADIVGVNLLIGMSLLWFFNPFDLGKWKNLYGIFCLFLCFIVLLFSLGNWSAWIFAIACLAGGYLGNSKKSYSYGIILLSAFFNLSFVSNTNFSLFQHDAASCINYIQYIQENHFMFWRENPILTRPGYSFFHPILHFFICAIGAEVTEVLLQIFDYKGDIFSLSLEGMQVLTCFYLFVFYIFVYKTINLFRFNTLLHLSCLLFVCTFPAYNTISGFLNNDALLLCMQAGMVYYALAYHVHGAKKDLWLLVLFSILAVFAKLSGMLVLPFISVVFLLKIIREKNLKCLKDLLFAGVVILLGCLIWPIYQYYHLGVSYDYVPSLIGVSAKSHSLYERLNLFPMFVFDNLFYMNDSDFNMWVAVLKTALFGEYNFYFNAHVLLWLMFDMLLFLRFIVLLFFVSFVYLIIYDSKNVLFYLFFILLLGVFGGYILFNIKYPFTCNQDFRYIAIVVLPISIMISMFVNKMPRFIQYFCCGVFLIFSILSVTLWWYVSLL